MKNLTQKLMQAGYICTEDLGFAVAAALSAKPVGGAFLFGPIGTGKTYLPEVLARVIGADYFFYQCFPGTREDDLLVKMLPSEDTVSGVGLHDGVMIQAVQATRKAEGNPRVVLVLDEWDKTRPSADSFLLDFLQTGRVNFAGRVLEADLSKLAVFLTFNIERELSEPLLRRLPLIKFPPLAPATVYRALSLTHRNHPYLYSAVILYERCLLADLPKPATIQELRQLLDAISLLGDQADWDPLVFQFVTKNEENHELLRRAEGLKTRWQNTIRPRLDASAYDHPRRPDWVDENPDEAKAMPSLARARGFDDELMTDPTPPDLKAAGGIIKLTRSAYNQLVKMVDQPGPEAHRLGQLATIHGRFISLHGPVPLSQVGEVNGLWGETGEILFVEPLAGWRDVKALPTWSNLEIVRFSEAEILAKIDGIDLRWSREQGAEIVVDLAKKHVFQHVFGHGWGAAGEGKWIGRKGLIYMRHQENFLPEKTGGHDAEA